MITNNLTVKWCFPYALFAIARDAVYVFVISFYFLYLSKLYLELKQSIKVPIKGSFKISMTFIPIIIGIIKLSGRQRTLDRYKK